ncbi:hypothetical protein B0H21DRAFT_826635 [Amylocystis lapponica]|nr:hypothetical protein B0H21DRAFT_829103 [Amylocystis lapponica]KAH9925715.1 hypothetical protein B0H21DRAFT_826635 [Amylocystis lapponica]
MPSLETILSTTTRTSDKNNMISAPRHTPLRQHFPAHVPNMEIPDNGTDRAGKANLGLGLILGTMNHSTAPAPATSRYSSRLRSMAPSPLQLTSPPPQYPVLFPAVAPRAESQSASINFVDVPSETSHNVQPPSTPSDTCATGVLTSLEYPEAMSSASMSSEIMQWQHNVSRAADAPVPHESVIPGATIAIAPAVFAAPEQRNAPNSPPHPSDDRPPPPSSAVSDVVVADSPPALQRSNWMELPPVPYNEDLSSSDESGILTPLHIDLREVLSIDRFILRAEHCAEVAGHAAMSLSSCGLLREPERIKDVGESLQQTFHFLRGVLDETPAELGLGGREAQRHWHSRHWQIHSSLDRNLNLFYLFAHLVRQRPPRIHRLAGFVDKMHAYDAKFADLARRLALSYEKLRILTLHARFVTANRLARAQADAERVRRQEFRAAWAEARARRREMREEIRHARGVAHALGPPQYDAGDSGRKR